LIPAYEVNKARRIYKDPKISGCAGNFKTKSIPLKCPSVTEFHFWHVIKWFVVFCGTFVDNFWGKSYHTAAIWGGAVFELTAQTLA